MTNYKDKITLFSKKPHYGLMTTVYFITYLVTYTALMHLVKLNILLYFDCILFFADWDIGCVPNKLVWTFCRVND